MKRILLALICFCFSMQISAQTNNFLHMGDYQTSEWGVLGEVKKIGDGEKNAILIPGWGFDWTIFKDFIKSHEDEYTFYAVTLPGFGKTFAPPMPKDSEKFKDLFWTNGIIHGINKLISSQNIESPILISYFTYANMIALKLALDYPEKIQKVIIISGMAKFMATLPSYEPRNLDERTLYVEEVMAKKWFKSIDKKKWDEGNFTPNVFTKDTLQARKYWDQLSQVPMPVAIRYLLEFYCTDLSLEYSKLKIPVLIIIPTFSVQDKNYAYTSSFFHDSWIGAKTQSKFLHLIAISDTQAFITNDQPDKLKDIIELFISNKLSPFDVFR